MTIPAESSRKRWPRFFAAGCGSSARLEGKEYLEQRKVHALQGKSVQERNHLHVKILPTMHFSSNYSAIANFAPGIMSMEVLIGIDATVCQNCFEEKSALRAQKGQVHIAGSIGFKTYMEVFIQNNPHTKKVDGSHKRFITLFSPSRTTTCSRCLWLFSGRTLLPLTAK